jgi:hypothetical protein
MTIINRLGSRMEVTMKVRRAGAEEEALRVGAHHWMHQVVRDRIIYCDIIQNPLRMPGSMKWQGYTRRANPKRDGAQPFEKTLGEPLHVTCQKSVKFPNTQSALSKRPMRHRCSIGENGIAGLLADHVNRGDDEETGDAGENGCVDDTKVLGAIDAEVTIHDGHRV